MGTLQQKKIIIINFLFPSIFVSVKILYFNLRYRDTMKMLLGFGFEIIFISFRNKQNRMRKNSRFWQHNKQTKSQQTTPHLLPPLSPNLSHNPPPSHRPNPTLTFISIISDRRPIISQPFISLDPWFAPSILSIFSLEFKPRSYGKGGQSIEISGDC